ncbi:orotidine-5'-phosphate decarboxylase [Candidatus Microgenomates bacterium]|nr:orotidine-5'-phosphate decarboxylase [Candidatus Microgenomates bacterium]
MTHQEQGRTPEPQESSQKGEFLRKLEAQWDKGNFVCVGLDSDWDNLPEEFRNFGRESGTFQFNRGIIDATADLVCAYKPNIAFYEDDPKALSSLKRTINVVHVKYPGIPVILDAKRADIGNTNNGYVHAAFDQMEADAVTVHPYLGKEALAPFLARKDKGIIVLVRTSNPGAGEFQDLQIPVSTLPPDTRNFFIREELDDYNAYAGFHTVRMYQVVAYNVAHRWNENGNCAVVVGATYPAELAKVRRIVGNMPILIPGIGVQGGEVEATVNAGKDSRGQGMVINSSRGIIFASRGADFAPAARQATENLRNEINRYRTAA